MEKEATVTEDKPKEDDPTAVVSTAAAAALSAAAVKAKVGLYIPLLFRHNFG